MQYKNTNSGGRNLLYVQSHIKNIGFELVLKIVLSDMERILQEDCSIHVTGSAYETRHDLELGLQMQYGVAGGV